MLIKGKPPGEWIRANRGAVIGFLVGLLVGVLLTLAATP